MGKVAKLYERLGAKAGKATGGSGILRRRRKADVELDMGDIEMDARGNGGGVEKDADVSVRVLPQPKEGSVKGIQRQSRGEKKFEQLQVGVRSSRVLSHDEVCTALELTHGKLMKAANVLGCHYSKLRQYLDDNKKARDYMDSVKDQTLDVVEDKLLDKIKEGNMTAIIFYLKCQGKLRGYVEDQQQDLSKLTQPITFIYQPAQVAISNNTPKSKKRITSKGQKLLPESTAEEDILPTGKTLQ